MVPNGTVWYYVFWLLALVWRFCGAIVFHSVSKNGTTVGTMAKGMVSVENEM